MKTEIKKAARQAAAEALAMDPTELEVRGRGEVKPHHWALRVLYTDLLISAGLTLKEAAEDLKIPNTNLTTKRKEMHSAANADRAGKIMRRLLSNSLKTKNPTA